MKIALVISKYFAGGGLQADLHRIAEECAGRGHQIELFTSSFEGDSACFEQVHQIKLGRWTTPARLAELARKSLRIIRKSGDFDLTLGFGRLPGMDLYFYGDDCYYLNYRVKPEWEKIFNFRINKFLALDRLPFSPFDRAKVMLLAAKQRSDFVKYYCPPLDKIIMLPPGIDRKISWPGDQQAAVIRHDWRERNRIGEKEKLLIFVGTFLFNKGADRLIEALSEFAEPPKLVIFGKTGKREIERQIRNLNLEGKVFFGRANEVYEGMIAADLLVHPARKEATGTVLAEALALHLPVICSSSCGYAQLIAEAGGIVLDSNVAPANLAKAIELADLPAMRAGAAHYAATNDLYRRPEKVAEVIEQMAASKIKFSAQKREQFYLDDFFADLWRGLDPLNEAEKLKGEIFRQVKNRKTLRIEIDGKGFFLKFHRGVGWLEALKNLVELKLPVWGADNEFKAILRLCSGGVDTMTATAFGRIKALPLFRKSFIITREITDAISLEDLAAASLDATSRSEIAVRLGNVVGRMHRLGIAHRDCYLCHFLRSEDGKLYIIDLHRALIKRKLSTRLLAKDLGGLAFSALNDQGKLNERELRLFWRSYRAANDVAANWHRIWRIASKRCAKLHLGETASKPMRCENDD